MKIIRRARVRRGDLFYHALERDHEEYYRTIEYQTVSDTSRGVLHYEKLPGFFCSPERERNF